MLGTLSLYRPYDRSRAGDTLETERTGTADEVVRTGRMRAVDRSELSKVPPEREMGELDQRPTCLALSVRKRMVGQLPVPLTIRQPGLICLALTSGQPSADPTVGPAREFPNRRNKSLRSHDPSGEDAWLVCTLWDRPAASLIGESISCRLFGLGRRMTRRAPGRESVWRAGGVGRKRSAVDLSVFSRAPLGLPPHRMSVFPHWCVGCTCS